MAIPVRIVKRPDTAPGLKMTPRVDLAPGNPNTLFVCSRGEPPATTRVKKLPWQRLNTETATPSSASTSASASDEAERS